MGEAIAINSEDLWNPYKELKAIVWRHLNEESDDLSSVEFENVLRKYKQNFLSLLQNPPKNAKSREELKKGMVDGITVKGIGHQILSKELYQETIILSDLFDINEFVALDLLCTAQIQMPYYPSLPRGLVAVLLYYDGRKALVSTLLYLVQVRSGVQWCVKVRPEIEKYVTDYTNQLMEGGLFNRIFELLRSLDLSKEMEKLQQNLALGGAKHRRQVVDLFNDIRISLADIVFSWSAQSGLPLSPTLALISYLREVKVSEEDATGIIDDVNLYLVMALLSALDLSILHTREDGEEAVQLLPILQDTGYIQSVINEFLPTKTWMSDGLQSLATFALSVCLASLRVVPQNSLFQEAINREEFFADASIEMNVFTFMHNCLLENKTLYKETYIYKRIHNLITDFIVYMYPKVKEMRLKADEIARTMQVYIREGLEAPGNLPRYFEYLLLVVGKFYSNDVLQSDCGLCYWSPIEISPNQSSTYRAHPRAVSLFKFIRLAGDMLPSTLFVPYLKMLSGLSSSQQAARHCFNMLKQMGAHISPTLSWDHFFASFAQYYTNLRQESAPVTDTVYRTNRPVHKGVSPQELDGLHAVLHLIRTIAENDEFSRLALCEHPAWSPLTVLLGLVSCSVPIPLKADLLLTLAALSKSSENAAQMWENLEASQILITIPSTSSYTPRGIQTELEEIESRMEEYPLTRSFLKLLDVLTTFGIPRTLGAGPRKPGFDPYLSFIVNSVFLKFHTRSYRDTQEKWKVALLCLKLFEKFLNQYDPNPDDFPKSSSDSEFNSPPGYHLMVQLNSKSELLNVILDIIDDGNKYFDAYVHFHGQETVKDCTLVCLSIIHRVLNLQHKFFNILTSSGTSIILTSLNKLLLTINRRSGRPDHCINIAKYVSYQVSVPKHSFMAVRILLHINSSPNAHNQLINILMSSENAKNIIKSGFVECLDALGEDEGEDVILSTKLEILKLLKQCLLYVAPNFTHFLLGFDMKRDVSKTEFQYPGVLDFPRSCLHSLVSIMDAAVTKHQQNFKLLESIYHMLYLLASNVKTSGPVLRFIRLNKTFFIDHLKLAHINLSKKLINSNQLSWLLKTVAIELKLACQIKQVSYLKQLTSFLVNIPAHDVPALSSDLFTVLKKKAMEAQVSSEDLITESFMSKLLTYIHNKRTVIDVPTWEYFDFTVLHQIISQCYKKGVPQMIDLKKLHKILYDELKTLHGTAVMAQVQGVTQEIPKVLKYALELNKQTEQHHEAIEFANAWRQVVEVLVVFTPTELISPPEQQIISISLAVCLLRKVVKVELNPDSAEYASGAILLMIDCIKRMYIKEQKMRKITPAESAVNILEIFHEPLRDILEGIIEWIMVSDVMDSELRINLYAAVVSFLQLTNMDVPHEDITTEDSMYVSRLDSSRYNVKQQEHKLKFSTNVLTKFGDKLVEVVCHDCVGGQEICQILAMSSFSHLIMLSGNINWIQFMSARGYLKYIIQSVMESDDDLKKILEPNAASIKPLYLYLAKMLLLCRIAETRVGAEMLLEQKLLSCLGNMSVYSLHPEISKSWHALDDVLEEFIPPAEQQYLQIWMPTLEVCTALLTALGTENQSAVVQIMYFLLNNLDVIELVLRSAHPHLSPVSLKELALVTSVISRTANNDLINVLDNPNINQNHRPQLYRLQKLMLSILPRFILSEETVRILNIHEDKSATSERLIHGMQVMANVVSYARNIVADHGIEHTGVGMIFFPSLSSPINSLSKSNEHEPSLGIIVQQLISTVTYQHQEKISYDFLNRKFNEIPDMNNVELKHFIGEAYEMCDIITKKERAYDVMKEKIAAKKRELEFCSFIIENCLYLIWVHLDYYMLKAIPKPKIYGHSLCPTLTHDATLSSSTEATWKVSTDTISGLKQGLVSLFNDSFSKSLLETAQDRSESDKAFVEGLLRKIKRLVQFVPVK